MRSGNSPGRIFCIVRPFTLLHFQEFAREGGHAPFLTSSHPSPPTMPSSACAKIISYGAPKNGTNGAAVPFFVYTAKQGAKCLAPCFNRLISYSLHQESFGSAPSDKIQVSASNPSNVPSKLSFPCLLFRSLALPLKEH